MGSFTAAITHIGISCHTGINRRKQILAFLTPGRLQNPWFFEEEEIRESLMYNCVSVAT